MRNNRRRLRLAPHSLRHYLRTVAEKYMIRIVGVQRAPVPDQEFVLLQNQGSMRLSLRGHALISEAALSTGNLMESAHAFAESEMIPPGAYVLLGTGRGLARWAKSKDGALIYYTYMRRDDSVWNQIIGQLHMLNTQHTYADRRDVTACIA